MDQREYDQMEDEINRREQRIEELQTLMVSPEVVSDSQLLQDYWNEQEQLQNEMEKLYARWEELEELKLI
jgi:ATP-binding cassette subfamily F protein uup